MIIYIYKYVPKVDISKYMKEMRTILRSVYYYLKLLPGKYDLGDYIIAPFTFYVTGIISYEFSSALLLLFQYR